MCEKTGNALRITRRTPRRTVECLFGRNWMRMESRLGTKAIRATPMYHCSMSARLDIVLEGGVKDAGVGLLLIACTTPDL